MQEQSELTPRIERLKETLEEVIRTAQNFPAGFVHQKPDPIAFSATEILYHLVDVEALWQSRVSVLVRNGSAEFQRFDPDKSAKDGNFNVRSFHNGIDAFRQARMNTFVQINPLSEEELSYVGVHPKFGSINVYQILDIMSNHDLGHAAQFGRTLDKLRNSSALSA